MNGGWQAVDGFNKFTQHLDAVAGDKVSKDMQITKANVFLETFTATAAKHFKAWLSTLNVVCTIAGDALLASAFAKWLIDGTLPSESKTFKSTHDDYVFNVRSYIEFIAATVSIVEIGKMEWFGQYRRAIELMAQGESIWTEEAQDPSLLALLQFVQERILPLMSSTHWIEYLIKETSVAATTGRDESMRSAITMIRSVVNPDVSRLTQVKKDHLEDALGMFAW